MPEISNRVLFVNGKHPQTSICYWTTDWTRKTERKPNAVVNPVNITGNLSWERAVFQLFEAAENIIAQCNKPVNIWVLSFLAFECRRSWSRTCFDILHHSLFFVQKMCDSLPPK